MGFGLELAALELDEAAEASLDAQSRAALRLARVAAAGDGGASVGGGTEVEAALDGRRGGGAVRRLAGGLGGSAAMGTEEEAALDVGSGGRVGGGCTSWVSFGLEVASLGLTAEEEASLDAQSLAAVRAVRAARLVEMRGGGLAASTESEATASGVGGRRRVGGAGGSSWLGFGLELA